MDNVCCNACTTFLSDTRLGRLGAQPQRRHPTGTCWLALCACRRPHLTAEPRSVCAATVLRSDIRPLVPRHHLLNVVAGRMPVARV